MSARLARLAGVRRVALVGELRALAAAERRIADLAAMRTRLDGLLGDVPAPDKTAGRKAAATTRAALRMATGRVEAAHVAAATTRGAAALAVIQAHARADAVAQAAARARTATRGTEG